MVTGYIYIYSSNPWESNHRDGPTGHKNNNFNNNNDDDNNNNNNNNNNNTLR